MNKKIILIIFVLLTTLLTTGCWDYRGLNEMTFVAGYAVDKVGKDYKLTYEIYDLQHTGTGQSIKVTNVESTGKTLFEAIRNAKRRVAKKLYFSEAKVMIISEKVAKEDGLNEIINLFIRDPEIRETTPLVISQEKTAAEVFKTKALTSTSVSDDILNIIKKDESITGSTENELLYQVFDIIKSEGMSLALPALHLVNNDGRYVVESNGIAAFKKDKFVSYLSPDDTKYYLLAKGKLQGGIITFKTKLKNNDKDTQNLSLEIKRSSSAIKYTSYKNELKVEIKPNIEVTLGELEGQNDKLNNKDINKLQKQAARIIDQRVKNVVSKIQDNIDSDILGFADKLHQSSPKEWKKIKKNYNDKFKYIDVNVKTTVDIHSTGFTK
jgi:spore germination protein KC